MPQINMLPLFVKGQASLLGLAPWVPISYSFGCESHVDHQNCTWRICHTTGGSVSNSLWAAHCGLVMRVVTPVDISSSCIVRERARNCHPRHAFSLSDTLTMIISLLERDYDDKNLPKVGRSILKHVGSVV